MVPAFDERGNSTSTLCHWILQTSGWIRVEAQNGRQVRFSHISTEFIMCSGTLKVTKYRLNIVRLISQCSFSCRITAWLSAETQLCRVGSAALADGSGLHLWNGSPSQVTRRVGASLLVKPGSSSEGTEEPLLSDRLVFHRHVHASVPPTLPSTHREIPANLSIDC